MGISQLGIQLLQAYEYVLKMLFEIMVWISRSERKELKTELKKISNSEAVSSKRRATSLVSLPRIAMLKIMKPFDSLLTPFPKNLTTLRIMIFKKLS